MRVGYHKIHTVPSGQIKKVFKGYFLYKLLANVLILESVPHPQGLAEYIVQSSHLINACWINGLYCNCQFFTLKLGVTHDSHIFYQEFLQWWKSIQISIYLFSHEGDLQLGEDYCNFSGSSEIRRSKSSKRNISRIFPVFAWYYLWNVLPW